MLGPCWLTPSTKNWYNGVVPPPTGFAVNVLDTPIQIAVVGVRVTEDETALLTVIVMMLDVAGLPDEQADKLELKTTFIWSPFAGI